MIGRLLSEIFAFLELEQISADFEIEHFSKVSVYNAMTCYR